MNENDIKKIWESGMLRTAVEIDTDRIAADLNIQLNDFKKAIQKRNMYEYAAIAILLPVTGAMVVAVQGTFAKIALAMSIPWAIWAAYKIYNVRHKEHIYATSMKAYLMQCISYLAAERKLVSSVLYWYILPPNICAVLFFIGLGIRGIPLLVMAIGIVVLVAFTYFLNQRSVKTKFDPLIKKLETTLSQLEDMD